MIFGISARADVNWEEIFCTHGLSFVHTGLYMGSRPAWIPHPKLPFLSPWSLCRWRGGGDIASAEQNGGGVMLVLSSLRNRVVGVLPF